MIPFLKAVAEGYYSRYNGDIKNICFVFPNKRARTFFLKYFRQTALQNSKKGKDYTIIAPHTTTISDLIALLSGRVIDSRIDLLFLLYSCYRELYPYAQDYDAFRRWGETILNDFNEVDLHLAEPEPLFKNLSDFKEISSTFLSQEEREVIEEYFGYRFENYIDTKFWRDFSSDIQELNEMDGEDEINEDDVEILGDETSEAENTKKISNSRKKFIRLWQILLPLYNRFNLKLEEKGLATSGLSYRLAISNLDKAYEENAVSRMLPYSKVVMVGFNALSSAEKDLFNLLKIIPSPDFQGESLGDFIWDATGPIICNSKNSAGHFVKLNKKLFPSPEWMKPYMKLCDVGNSLPDITTVAAPSKVAQVKIASDLIADLHQKIGSKPFEDANVALIIPDQGLLIPMLYSLPDKIEDANLTMGYPLKLTSVTSFLMLLRKMQLFRRDSSSYKGYDFEEIDNLLSHPYAQAIIGHDLIRKFRYEFQRKHIRVVRDYDLEKWLGKNASILLEPINADASPLMVCDYLKNVLNLIAEHLHNNVEKAHVDAWREALNIFADSLEEYNIQMSPAATLAEAYRLLSGEVVPFEGEPLKGLQIMGLLETRLLDFDYIYVISVNDKIIPMTSRKRSFLPNVIRRAYGLPPVNYQENIFSYYFYRLLSRAKNATLIYDNRTSGLTRGVSRYIMQLKYLHARNNLREIEFKFNPTAKDLNHILIPKSNDILENLAKFENNGIDYNPENKDKIKYFSASNLKKYLSCPLKFYYSSILNLDDNPLPSEGVDYLTFGNIVHSLMEMLYLPEEEVGKGRWLEKPIEITSEFIDSILADEDRLKYLLKRLFNKKHYHLSDAELERELEADTALVAESALIQIKELLKYDRSLTPFNLYGCEVRQKLSVVTESNRKINLTFAIDRIDDAQCEGNENTIRIVDYKTGSAHTKATSISAIFSDDYASEHLFQLLLYADILNEWRLSEGKSILSVKPIIYSIPKIKFSVSRKNAIPNIGGIKIEYHDQEWDKDIHSSVRDEFMSEFDNLIEEIFDEEKPFAGVFNEDKCNMCVYSSICQANNNRKI